MRNFAIIAHIDHGKSTLADRLLELTGAIPTGGRKQYLDRLEVERARGITVKAQSASLLFTPRAEPRTPHLLNLIDTPGHVDFSYEVSRSLAACQGCLLLVDASQGIQAQTIANHRLAVDAGLTIVPVLNKIDLPSAEPERVAAQMVAALSISESSILRVSAKSGLGVDLLLEALVQRLPPPNGQPDGPLRALLLVRLCSATGSACLPDNADSHHPQDASWDVYRGAVCIVNVVDGVLRSGDRIVSAATGEACEVMEVGFLAPEPVPMRGGSLRAGAVGYIITSSRSLTTARVGDTLLHVGSEAKPLPGFKAAKPMIFQGLFPATAEDYEVRRVLGSGRAWCICTHAHCGVAQALKAAVERLVINDSSVTLSPSSSTALGPGFNAGFLGLLHADVFHQRLRDEYGASVIATAPTVPFHMVVDGVVTEVCSPTGFPDPEKRSTRARFEELLVDATIITPSESVGRMVELCVSRRGVQLDHTFIDNSRALLRYRMPMGEIAADFADEVKSRSAGYASFDYEHAGWQVADIVRVDILVNGQPVDALASVCHRDRAARNGRLMVEKLKAILPNQLFEVALQASVNGKVVARESMSAMRKNVLAKCYGGDVSRKQKLLSKQAAGKKKMRRIGNVDVPHEAFSQLLRGS